MIKGVSRYAVEIDKTNSPFFEKVICFVRPQFADGNSLDLHREAMRMVNNLSSGVEEAQHGSQHILRVNQEKPQCRTGAGKKTPENRQYMHNYSPTKWLPLVLSAGGGAAAALLLSAIF